MLREYKIIGLYILCSKYLQLVRFRGKRMSEAAFLWPAVKTLITEIVTSERCMGSCSNIFGAQQ